MSLQPLRFEFPESQNFRMGTWTRRIRKKNRGKPKYFYKHCKAIKTDYIPNHILWKIRIENLHRLQKKNRLRIPGVL